MATLNGASIPSVKLEGDHISFNGDEPRIKQDPDVIGASPAALSDDDIYEDAGDLDFSSAQQSVWLTRLPKFLWENWSKIDDDEEIELGTIRIESTPGNNGDPPKVWEPCLRREVAQLQANFVAVLDQLAAIVRRPT